MIILFIRPKFNSIALKHLGFPLIENFMFFFYFDEPYLHLHSRISLTIFFFSFCEVRTLFNKMEYFRSPKTEHPILCFSPLRRPSAVVKTKKTCV